MIYKYYIIICKLNDKLGYIGRTKRNLEDRIKEHKFNSKFSPTKKYQIIRENGGFDNFECTLIEEKEFNNIRDADLHEEMLRQQRGAVMNKNSCYNTDSDNKKWKEKILICECGKAFRQDNKSHHIKTSFHKKFIEKV